MKTRGAKFRLGSLETEELIYYYTNKNNLSMQKKDDVYTIDKKLVKKTINDIVEDLNRYYDIHDLDSQLTNQSQNVYDKTSGIEVACEIMRYPLKFKSFKKYEGDMQNAYPYEDYTIVLCDDLENYSWSIPCIFVNKNTKKDNAYKIASMFFTENFQYGLYNEPAGLSVVIDKEDVKKSLNYDNNWNYTYDFSNRLKEEIGLSDDEIKYTIDLVRKSYESYKSMDTNNFYMESSVGFNGSFHKFICDEISIMLKTPELSDGFEKRLDEYITNYNVVNN